MISIIGLVFHDVGESLLFLHNVHPSEQTRINALPDDDIEFVDVPVNGSTHRNDLLVSSSENDSGGCDLLVLGNLLTEHDVHGVNDGGVFEFAVHHMTVAVQVVPVHVRVLITVCSRAWVKAVGSLPLVRHLVLVGVCQPRRSEVALAEDLCDLIFFEVVHAVFVPIPVAVGSVCWIEHVGSVGRHGGIRITVLETVGHAVAVRVPVGRAVEKPVAVHVHHEPAALHAVERSGACFRLEKRFVAGFTHAGVEGNGCVGHLNDVIDEVHVRVPGRRVGSENFLFEVRQTVVVRVEDHVARVAVVGGKVVPICHAVLAVESALKSINHGLVEEQAIPISVEGIEENDFAAGRLYAGGVE